MVIIVAPQQTTMKFVVLSALINLLAVQGFVPSSSIGARTSTPQTVLSAQPKQQEKELREELAERTSKIDDEGKYALRDGPQVLPREVEGEVIDEVTGTIPEDAPKGEILARRMEKLKRRRVYPLFLAEKALEVVETLLPTELASAPAKRERIVVLGTGWGAVSFLKTVDTSLYDVTVISPRNYFLFTPMLGTCEATVLFINENTCLKVMKFSENWH